MTLLVENTARGRGILAEHGLAWWIENPAGKLLFDTGQGQVLERNAEICGIALEEAAAVVLSHGHYDHVGALERVLSRAPKASVFLHPGALQKRYSGAPGGRTREVNEPFLYDGGLEHKADRIVPTREAMEVMDGIHVTGEVPRITDYEDTGGDFYLDADGLVRDPIIDDQSIYFQSDRGTVLILGCAHAGVVNTMLHVANLTGRDRIHAVMGGMHLLHADPERLQMTYEVFRKMDVALIAPCHCTGIRAVAGFWNSFPDQCVEAHAGKEFKFNLKKQS